MALRKKIISDEIIAIHEYIKHDISPLLRAKDSYYGPLSLIFALINYLGALYSGKPDKNNKETIEFIKEFFNPKYKDYPGLMYIINRHGLIHERIPKLIQLSLKGHIIHQYTDNVRRRYHLQIVNAIRPNNRHFVAVFISIPRLIDDLHEAIDSYFLALYKNNEKGRLLRKNFALTWKVVRKPKNEIELTRLYKYLDTKEFTKIRGTLKKVLPEISLP